MKHKTRLTAALLAIVLSAAVLLTACADFTEMFAFDQPDLGKEAALTLDGKSADTARIKGEGAHKLAFRWSTPVEMNTVLLYEKSGNVINDFKIYIDDQDDYVYRQDEIGKVRTAYLGTRTISELTVAIDGADGKYDVSDVKIVNMPRDRDDFKVFSYIVLGENGSSFDSYDLESVKHITDAVLFGDTELSFDQHGNVNINTPVVDRAIDALRAVNPSIRIHACFLPKSDGNSAIDNLEWPRNIVAIHHGAFQSRDFLNNLLAAVQTYGFDGIGFDYEYPQTLGNYREYSDFLKKLRKALPQDRRVTCAMNHWTEHVDWANVDNLLIMTYDNIGRYNAHSNWADGIVYALESIKNHGMPKEKVMIGLPFYSRPTTLTESGSLIAYWGDYYTDYQKMGRFTNLVKIDEEREILWQDQPLMLDSLYYNSYQMICDKTAMCYDYGAGGVMIWNYGSDVPYSDLLSLHRAINEALGG